MALATGGRMPFDASGALAGPARVLYADPAVLAAAPVNLWDVVPAVADASGEYPAEADWSDFGLAADAPTYTHSKDTNGLEYQQSQGVLFEKISAITRTFTAQVGQIDPDNMVILENNDTIEAIAAASGQSAVKKVPFGVYASFRTYRVCLVTYRPDGAAIVIEPNGKSRPPAVALILPLVVLSAEDTAFTFSSGDPVNAAVTFTCLRDDTQDAGEEHGFWIFEEPGTIA